MKLKQYQIDAFTEKVFSGNPAAVCKLDKWLDDKILLAIAEENNLSETAYIVQAEKGFHLRWFTPTTEIKLCGHATLAAAFVVFDILKYGQKEVVFETLSGDLIVTRDGKILTMDFPSYPPQACEPPANLIEGLGKVPKEFFLALDALALYETEEDVLSLKPDFSKLINTPRGVIVTAPSNDKHYDFVSRFFAPRVGINEDPVTGSAHCQLAPFWSSRLGKTKFNARQLSKRGGEIQCELVGERVLLSGQAVKVMEAEIFLR